MRNHTWSRCFTMNTATKSSIKFSFYTIFGTKVHHLRLTLDIIWLILLKLCNCYYSRQKCVPQQSMVACFHCYNVTYIDFLLLCIDFQSIFCLCVDFLLIVHLLRTVHVRVFQNRIRHMPYRNYHFQGKNRHFQGKNRTQKMRVVLLAT